MGTFPETPVTLLGKLAQQMTCDSDEVAWTRLFELYAPAIRKFAEAQGAKGDADDVVQEIFLKLVDILRDGKYQADVGKFRRYLATLIRREIVSRWRKQQARGGSGCVSMDDPEAEIEIAAPSEVEAQIDAKWRLARHQAAVEHVLTRTALSQQSKDVYRFYVLEDHPVEWAVEKFNMPRNSIYQIKTRVEKMLALIEAEYDG